MTKPVHVPPYLTQEEVNALPNGTEIVVTWSGGNGPWKYLITKPFGLTMVSTTKTWPIGIDVVDFVGDKKPHTLVTLAVP